MKKKRNKKKQKFKYAQIDFNDFFNYEVHIYIGSNWEAIALDINKKFGIVQPEHDMRSQLNAHAHTFTIEYTEGDSLRSTCVIILPEPFEVYVAVHEAVHASWRLGTCCGFNFNNDNQEIQAYLTDGIFRKIMELSKGKRRVDG